MADSEYLIVTETVRERRGLSRRSKAILAGIAAACFLAAAIALIASSRSSSSSSSSSSKAVRPNFATNSILQNAPTPTSTTFTDDTGKIFMTTNYTYSYTDTLMRTTSVNYNITHIADFHSLETDTRVVGCTMDEQGMHVTMDSPASAATHHLVPEHFVAVRPEWGTPAKIVRVVSTTTVGNVVHVQVEDASLTDVVMDCNIEVTTNHPAPSNRSVDMSSSQQRQRRDFSSWLEDEWPTIKQWAGYIMQGANLIITGDLTVDDATPYTGSWSFGGPTNCGLNVPDVTASCGAQFGATVHFSLNIQNYSVQSVSLTVDGDMTLSANGDFSITEPYSNSNHQQLYNQEMWSGVVNIGSIPIPISVWGQLMAGYDLTASAALNVQAQAQLSGTVQLGMQYANGQMNYVYPYTLTPTHSASGNAEETATLVLNTMPVLLLKAAYIGGPTVQLSMTGQVTVTATQNGDLNDDNQFSGCEHATAGFTDSIQIVLGAELDITINGQNEFQKTWDFTPVADHTYPISSQCIGQ